MAAPRLVSRPDRSSLGRARSCVAQKLADYTDAREFFRAQQRDSRLIDPGRLIESVFLGVMPEDDAEAVLIAWLAVLPEGTDAPSAASDLTRHLNQLLSRQPTLFQRRLLDLLAYVAAHKRSSDLKQEVKP